MGALKSGAFPVELKRQRIWFTFSLNALDESTGKVWGLRQIKVRYSIKITQTFLKLQGGYLRCFINEALLAEDENASCLNEKRVRQTDTTQEI